MIVLKQVDLSYPKHQGDILALADINLELGAGEFTAIMGANGSGKTSLAKVISGLLHPTEGRAETSGPAMRIGFLGASPPDQLVAQTVEEEIAFGLENLSWDCASIRRRVDEVLESFGLREIARRQSRQLSAGQQQKVALAGLVALHPQYLVLDEPLTHLDDVEAEQVANLILEQHLRHGLGLVWITQDERWVAGAHRLLVLSQGRIIWSGSPRSNPPQDMGDLGGFLSCRTTSNPPCLPLFKGGNTGTKEPRYLLKACGIGLESQGIHILRDISFQVNPGECWAVVGRNGAGKTTLAKVLCGLLSPTSGQVSLTGRSARVEPDDGVRLLFQFAEMQFFQPTVKQDLGYPLKQRGYSSGQIDALIHTALEQAGLELGDIDKCSPFELSTGQQRRLALASLLVLKPRILVLDEPFSGLDNDGKKVIADCLLRLNRQAGVTLIIISHSPANIPPWVTHALVLQAGRQIFCGPAGEGLHLMAGG